MLMSLYDSPNIFFRYRLTVCRCIPYASAMSLIRYTTSQSYGYWYKMRVQAVYQNVQFWTKMYHHVQEWINMDNQASRPLHLYNSKGRD